MMYALAITIAAGLLLLALLVASVLLARRAADGRGLGPVKGWRWYPSPLGLMLLLPLAGLLLWRMVPALLLIPILLPFFWRQRRLARPFLFIWNLGRQARPPSRDRDGKDDAIEGQYRPLDD